MVTIHPNNNPSGIAFTLRIKLSKTTNFLTWSFDAPKQRNSPKNFILSITPILKLLYIMIILAINTSIKRPPAVK